MKRFDNVVLNRLLDSYEKSASYAFYAADQRSRENEKYLAEKLRSDLAAGSGTDLAAGSGTDLAKKPGIPPRRRGVFCRIDEKSFPEYFDTVSGDYEILHEQLQELERKGLVNLYWGKGKRSHILEKAALITEHADECYAYLRRKPKWKKEAGIISICRTYRDRSGDPVLNHFLDWTENRLNEGESVKRLVDIDDPAGFERICRLLLAILSNDQDVYLRQFSVSLFHDSKIAERELEKTVSIIKEFSTTDSSGAVPDYADLTSDEVLEVFGIYRNPVWLYMKGFARISISSEDAQIADVDEKKEDAPVTDGAGKSLTLTPMENGIGITLRDLDLVKPDASDPPECVLTVENLTTYYQMDTFINGMKTLVVYLGGFAGRQKRCFLQKLRKAYPDAIFMHAGDIDCGGFRIWKALCEGTGIRFTTYHMDVDTYERFRNSGRPLSEQDRMSLEVMKADPFFADQRSLFERMLQTGVKLEQESYI